MTELHVGPSFALRTLAMAANVAKAGDVVVVHTGVYPAGLKPAGNTAWVAAEGEAVVIDGGWRGKPVNLADANANGVLIRTAGVTLRGFEIRNIAGKGVAVAAGGDGFLMEDCWVHHTVEGGFGANGTGTPIRGITLRRCHLSDLSLSGRWQETPVNGCCLFKMSEDVLVEDCLIERGYGEGIAAGSRSVGVVFRRVTVRDTAHLAMYVANRARDVLVENCIVYQTGDDTFRQGDGDVGAGFVIGDEESGAKDDKWQNSENVTLRGCVAVNCGIAFQLRNGTKPGKTGLDGYNTRIQNLTVERCTFVTGPDSKLGINIGENDQGAKVRGVFRDNLFVLDQMRTPDAQRFRVLANGVQFQRNAWTAGVPSGIGGDNVAVPRSALVAPDATGFALDNYRPRAGGPLDGAGYGALAALVDEPGDPPVDPPPPPPPPPPPVPLDRAALLARVIAVAGQLDEIHIAVDVAMDDIAALVDALGERGPQ